MVSRRASSSSSCALAALRVFVYLAGVLRACSDRAIRSRSYGYSAVPTRATNNVYIVCECGGRRCVHLLRSDAHFERCVRRIIFYHIPDYRPHQPPPRPPTSPPPPTAMVCESCFVCVLTMCAGNIVMFLHASASSACPA